MVTFHSDKLGGLLKDHAAMIIRDGRVDRAAMKTHRITEKDLLEEARLHTALALSNVYNTTDQSFIIMANLTNTGTETISDFKHMDVLVYDQEQMKYEICSYDEAGGTAGTWNIADRYGEFIHPYSLDPGERYQLRIMSNGNRPKWIQVTTANGVYASAFL